MKINSGMRKISLLVIIILCFSVVTVYAIEGYSELYQTTSSIFSLPNDCVKGQINIGTVGVTLSQFVNNGNLSDGKTNWLSASTVSGLSVSNNTLSFTASAKNGKAVQKVNLTNGKTYFLRAIVKADTPLVRINFAGVGNVYHSGSGDFETLYLKVLWNYASQQWDLTIEDTRTSGWTQVEVQKVMAMELDQYPDLINLSADEINTRVPNWFDGTKSTILAHRVKAININLVDYININNWHNYNVIESTGDIYNAKYQITSNNDEITIKTDSGSRDAALEPFMIEPNTEYEIQFEITNISGTVKPNLFFYSSRPIVGVNPNYICVVKGIEKSSTGLYKYTFTTPANARYLLPAFFDTGVFTVSLRNLQISRGSYEYMEHNESNSYLLVIDENRNTLEAHSLPNGVKDEVSGGVLYKRTKKITLDGTLSWAYSADYTGYKRVKLKISDAYGTHLPLCVKDTGVVLDSGVSNSWDSTDLCYTNSTPEILLTISDTDSGWAEDYVPSQTDIQAYFNTHPYTLIYQLAQPTEHKLITTPLVGYPNGTVIVEPVVRDAAMYNNGIKIDDETLPIEYIESVSKIYNGTKTLISLDKIKINNEFSFTIEGAKNGEIYEYIYKYPSQLTTMPTIEYSVPINLQGQINGEQKMIELNGNTINEIINRIQILRQQLQTILDIE